MDPAPTKPERNIADVDLYIMDAEMTAFWRTIDPALKLRIFHRMSSELFSRLREVVQKDYPEKDKLWIVNETHRRLGNSEFYPVRYAE